MPMPVCWDPWPGNRNAVLGTAGQRFTDWRAAGALVGLDDFATGVVAAVWADVVRPSRLAALRARLQLHEAKREVRAAPSFAALGKLYLRKSHERAEVYQEDRAGPGPEKVIDRPGRPLQPMRGSRRIRG